MPHTKKKSSPPKVENPHFLILPRSSRQPWYTPNPAKTPPRCAKCPTDIPPPPPRPSPTFPAPTVQLIIIITAQRFARFWPGLNNFTFYRETATEWLEEFAQRNPAQQQVQLGWSCKRQDCSLPLRQWRSPLPLEESRIFFFIKYCKTTIKLLMSPNDRLRAFMRSHHQ